MKRIISTFLVFLLLLVAVVGGGYLYYRDHVENPLVDPKKPVEITVRENEPFYEVLSRLENEKVIRSSNIAKIYYRLTGRNLDIKPGVYHVKAGGTLKDLLDSIQGVNTLERVVTIPEGFTIDQIGDRLQEAGLFDKTAFIEAVKKYPVPSYVKTSKERRYALEGFLFPNTYTFNVGVTPEQVIKEMNDAFVNSMQETVKAVGKDIPMKDWDEIIVKASMIEMETYVPEERPVVASVIENRLKDGMKLQIDATILYAVGDQNKEITMDDILMENPYNTYHVDSLPVGPICNPSKEAIAAVLKPAATDYIFYVLNPATNKHYFTKDYDDFEKKKEEFAGMTTVPKASNTGKYDGPVLSTGPSSSPYESTKGYSSNTLNTEDGKIEFPRFSMPEGFFRKGSSGSQTIPRLTAPIKENTVPDTAPETVTPEEEAPQETYGDTYEYQDTVPEE